MNERLKEIRKSMNMNQSEFSQLLGIGQSTLAMMEVSKRDIADRHIKTICAICKIDEHWFRTGEGEMFVDNGDDFMSEMASRYDLDALQQSLIRAVYEMPPEQRQAILSFARKLVSDIDGPIETERERITRVTNDYLDAYEDQSSGQETNKKA